MTLARAQRNLAIHMGEAGASNAVKLKKMFRWFEAACAMLGVEVLLWIIDLAWRR